MPLEHVFAGFGLAVEPLPPPAPGEPNGKRMIIIDPQTGENWSYAMTDEQAKLIGGKLLGLGEVQTASPSDLQRLNGKRKLN